ncbi:MAG: hypothetical protein E7335_04405 [Clostridiales bacterium]|nr:hypothetical protein [Clostridiales bacterium]
MKNTNFLHFIAQKWNSLRKKKPVENPEIVRERNAKQKRERSTLGFQGASKFYNSCRQLFDGSGTGVH